MKKYNYFYLVIYFLVSFMYKPLSAQITAIPDPNFETKLIALGVDTDGIVNGQILTADATRSVLNLDNSNISNLEGIEAFVNLYELRCAGNNLTHLDLSSNVNMRNLYANNNQLRELYLHRNSQSMSIVHCRNNNLLHLNLTSCGNIGSLETLGNPAGLRVCLDIVGNPNFPYYLYDATTIMSEYCYAKAVEGQVYIDANNNCTKDTLEQGLKNQLVEFSKWGEKTYFTTIDSNGHYDAYLDTGTYTVNFVSPSNYWTSCVNNQTITISNYTVQTLDIGLDATILCPFVEVDVSAPFIRRAGGGSNYTVSYCNRGTEVANNAYVEVDIDPDLMVMGTSVPIASQSGNIYQFNVGNLALGACGSFTINVVVVPSAIVGQTHCSEAHIYPDSICAINWQGARMNVTSQCNSDSIYFTIQNSGAAMASPSAYYVFEDNIMMRQGTFQLIGGGSVQIIQPVLTGRTYRINVEQENGFPSVLGDPVVSSVLEGCDPRSDGSFNTGFVTQFSNGNSNPSIARDCQQNRASYDPNDKSAQPVGYDSTHHYINQYIGIDYKVRFQNTGTDTAFDVVILDTISPYLNIGSLRMGTSSHAYTWTIINDNVLKVMFYDIKLPDSLVNEPLSHGFFRYRIEQMPNNPIGTIINNFAAIYFDFNPPIITNTTWHTVGEDFEEIDVAIDKIFVDNIDVDVYPNPFIYATTIEVKEAQYQHLELSVFDLGGRAVPIEVDYDNNKLQLHRGNLQTGIYIYHLKGDGKPIVTGKITVQ